MTQPPKIQFGAHFNQESKYWPAIQEKYVDQAGIHALTYFEAKTLTPNGLKNVLQGPRYQARKIITLITTDTTIIPQNKELTERPNNQNDWTENSDLKPSKGNKKINYIRKHYKPKHNKSNTITQ